MGSNPVVTTKLSDLCELIVDCPHSTPKWTDSGFVVLRNQNIRNGALDLTSPSYTDEAGYNSRIKRAVPQAGDIVITREAPMGEVCIIPEGLQCCLGQRQVLLRPKKGISNEYLFWALQSPFVKHQISWNEGTGTTVSNIRIPVLKAFEIPRWFEQEPQIAAQLSAIDNKITLNRQINQTLEQMAQALFKSWFVDFDPVIDNALDVGNPIPDELQHRAEARKAVRESEGFKQLPDDVRQLFPDAFEESELGWVPKGWEIKCLRDLSEKISKGTTPRKSDLESALEDAKTALFVKVKDMTDDCRVNLDSLDSIPKSVSTGVLKRSVLCEGDILLSIAGTIGRVASVERELDGSNCNQAVAFLRPKDRLAHHLFIKQTLLSTRVRHYIDSKVVQAVQANFSLTHFGEIQTVMPSEQVIKQFNLLANTYSSRSLSALRQNDTLTKLRDTLLPKLISGELRLDDVETAVKQETVSA